jgi:hypothetical protein
MRQVNPKLAKAFVSAFQQHYKRVLGSCIIFNTPAAFPVGTRSHYIPLCRVVSCRVVSCRVVSCRVVSCRVVSCRVVSCRVAGSSRVTQLVS